MTRATHAAYARAMMGTRSVVAAVCIAGVAALAVSALASAPRDHTTSLRICAGGHSAAVRNVQAVNASCELARRFSGAAAAAVDSRGRGFDHALHIDDDECTYAPPVTDKSAVPLYSAVSCHSHAAEIEFDQIVRRARKRAKP